MVSLKLSHAWYKKVFDDKVKFQEEGVKENGWWNKEERRRRKKNTNDLEGRKPKKRLFMIWWRCENKSEERKFKLYAGWKWFFFCSDDDKNKKIAGDFFSIFFDDWFQVFLGSWYGPVTTEGNGLAKLLVNKKEWQKSSYPNVNHYTTGSVGPSKTQKSPWLWDGPIWEVWEQSRGGNHGPQLEVVQSSLSRDCPLAVSCEALHRLNPLKVDLCPFGGLVPPPTAHTGWLFNETRPGRGEGLQTPFWTLGALLMESNKTRGWPLIMEGLVKPGFQLVILQTVYHLLDSLKAV